MSSQTARLPQVAPKEDKPRDDDRDSETMEVHSAEIFLGTKTPPPPRANGTSAPAAHSRGMLSSQGPLLLAVSLALTVALGGCSEGPAEGRLPAAGLSSSVSAFAPHQ